LLNAMTVDVEEWFQVSNFDALVDRSAWDSYPSRVVDSTRTLLSLLEMRDTRATFFVLGWVAERQPDLVAEIADAGHEVASHGYGHELVYRLSPEAFAEDLTRSLDALMRCGVASVEGYRAPSFSMDARTRWAWDVLAERGIKFDSSIYPVRHPRYGTPEFSRFPVTLRTPERQTVREFPLTTLRVLGNNVGASGGGYLRVFPPAIIRTAITQANRAGHPAVVYVHPWELDPAQPRLPVRGLGRVTHYTNLAATYDRLDDLLARFRFGTMTDALREAAGVEAPVVEVP
jgi:polysaccharide deacetylase family protein (PEP-CTERM system associated)